MSITLQTTDYGGWTRCYRLANDALELLLTGEVGPRILRLSALGGENLFHEFKAHRGKTGGDEWRSYGGHRFWHAPEAKPRSYYPDNDPVTLEEHEEGRLVRVRQRPEATSGLQKVLELRLAESGPHLRLTHRLENHGLWPLQLAPWALSVMRPGGTALIPLPPRRPHPEALLPSSTLTLWPYTDLADARFRFGRRSLRLRQDSAGGSPQKIGASVPDGWCAYLAAGYIFVKRFAPDPNASYPDLGSMVEVFTNDAMLELETLGPLQTLEPGGAIEHDERWSLFELPDPPEDEDALLGTVLGLLERAP